MAMKVDRPAGGTGDDVVAFVARSLDEARAARDALVAAGIRCEMPDAALEAMFASGTTSVPVRVSSRDIVRALDVIDAHFPPPPEPDEPVDLPPPSPPPAPATAREEAGDASSADAEEESRLDEAARRSQGARLERTALKVATIACVSVLLPGAGALFGLFAAVAAAWCLARTRDLPGASPKVRRRAGLGLVVGVVSFVGNAAFAIAWLANR
jgi:hypothetical protein